MVSFTNLIENHLQNRDWLAYNGHYIKILFFNLRLVIVKTEANNCLD